MTTFPVVESVAAVSMVLTSDPSLVTAAGALVADDVEVLDGPPEPIVFGGDCWSTDETESAAGAVSTSLVGTGSQLTVRRGAVESGCSGAVTGVGGTV